MLVFNRLIVNVQLCDCVY